jgi:cell wall-associated NlpC family hydrolase
MPSRLRARLRAIVAATLTVGVLATAVQPAGADSNDIRQKVKRIADQLESAEGRIDQAAEAYNVALQQLDQARTDVAESQKKVDALQAKLDKLQGNVADFAVQQVVGGEGSSAMSSLLTDNGSITASVERDQYTKLILDSGSDSVDQLDATVHDLANEKASLERKQQHAEQLVKASDKAKSDAESLRSKLQDDKAKAEAEYGQALVQEQAAREAAIEKAAAQEAARQRANATAAASAAAAAASRARSGGGGGSTDTRGGGDGGGSGGGSGGIAAGHPVPAVSAGASGAVAAALSQIGVPYRFAAASPGVAFDCSGLTSWAWGRAGVSLPHQSQQQYNALPHVSKDQAQPGDLLFYHSPISHVALYIGGGRQVHAPATGKTVEVVSVNWGRVVGVARP